MMNDLVSISRLARQKLEIKWGPECVLRCCKDWLSHYMIDMNWGTCGFCGKKPELIVKNWDDYTTGR